MLPFISKPVKVLLIVAGFLTFCFVLASIGFFMWTKQIVAADTNTNSLPQTTEVAVDLERFPVGVSSVDKEITEDPLVDWYIETHLSINVDDQRRNLLLDRVLAQVAKWDWYQSLASSVSRILVIYPGERREEVVDNIGDILRWDAEERKLFTAYITEADPLLKEGKFYPGRYVVPYDATPELVADALYERFTTEILLRYDAEVEKYVPLSDALTIASLLEREAYDFTDMRYISGIIWNRLFVGMPLQLDATLQYARGSKATESLWWPRVVPADKYINSPYNTYENEGLPPAPISNTSVEAVVAALNPRQTDCMFYFHDPRGKFYCTETYEEHVAMLKKVYGRGK